MDVEEPPSNSFSRAKTAPFLIRTFVKIGSFHRLTLFEDGTLPTTDEVQLFTWKDATLRELLTTLRNTAPHVAEYKHPLARFSFRIVYADPSNKGRFAQKEIGMVYSRDILGEPGALGVTAPRLLRDYDDPQFVGSSGAPVNASSTTGTTNDNNSNSVEKNVRGEEKTLEDLRFMPGDFLCVAVLLKKSVTTPNEPASSSLTKTPSLPAPTTDWRKAVADGAGSGARGDSGWGRSSGLGSSGPPGGTGRGGGHWRGGSNAVPIGGRGGGGGGGGRRGDFGRDRDRDYDSRVPPPRTRDYSPPRGGGRMDRTRGGYDGGRAGGRSRSRSFSRSRSRSPPRRRGGRYD